MAKILIVRYVKLMNSIIDRTIAIYEVNADTKSHKRAILLQNMSLFSEMILIGGFMFYMYVGALHLINPIYQYFWQHEFRPLTPLYIPFVDEKTTVGYAILITMQFIQVSASVVCSSSFDFPFMILILNIWIFTTIFEDSVNELNGILRGDVVDMSLAKKKLENLFEMYKDIWM